ncbi:MAG: hypothetical protein Q8L81_12685 [Bacteroidota bacterium]|nr:hypothetical protein [Bacteroidota bacterium]
MILLQTSTVISQNTFWTYHLDFWLFLVIGLVSFIYTYRSFRQAEEAKVEATFAKQEATEAKNAANRAGKTVKKQTIILAISDTIKMCQIRGNISYEDANNELMEISGKVRNIMGLFRQDLGQTHQALFQQIESCISDVTTEFNLLDVAAEHKTIYTKIRPVLSALAGHLNELQGIIENELIINH